jgi:hypothetical protein
MLATLPEHILVEIFRLLSLQDIIRLQSLCQSFNSLFRSFPMVLFNTLRGLYPSPFFPSDVRPTYQSAKRLFSRLYHAKVTMLEMLAYATNGGYQKNDPYESMINVFTSNLFDSCYAAIRCNNVLIKALFCGGRFQYTASRGDWEKKALRTLLPSSSLEIELTGLKSKLQTVLKNTCKEILLTGFCVEKPSALSKSSFRTCAIFSSLHEETDTSLIKRFYFCSTVKKVRRIATSLSLSCTEANIPDLRIVFFSKARAGIRPLCWMQFLSSSSSPDVLDLALPDSFLGSYLYFLFIDSFDPYSPGLSVGTFIAKGRILSLYE